MYDISKAQFDDIGNTQSKVGFEYQGGCDALIWSASGKPCFMVAMIVLYCSAVIAMVFLFMGCLLMGENGA